MTVMSLRRLVAWPLRQAVVTRHLGREHSLVHPERHAHYDSFFADPANVEDDYRRMRPKPR
jgi:hypothetical protein